MAYKVLIVDDDAEFVEQLQGMSFWKAMDLQVVDIEVLGISGIGKFFTYEPDILLLSESVYIMSGEEFLHMIQQAHHSYCVIYRTNQPLADDKMFPQIVSYLEKGPLDREKLLQSFHKAINRLKSERAIQLFGNERESAQARSEAIMQLFGNISAYQFEHLQKQYALNLYASNLVLAAVRIPPNAEAFIQQLVDILKQYGNGETFKIEEQVQGILFNLPVGSIIYQNKIREKILQMLGKCLELLPVECRRIYVSASTYVTALSSELQTIHELMQYDYFTADVRVVRKYVEVNPEQVLEQVTQLCEKLGNAYFEVHTESFFSLLKQIFLVELKRSMSMDARAVVRAQLQEILQSFDGLEDQEDGPAGEFDTLEQEYAWYKKRFEDVMQIKENQLDQMHSCVFYAQEYIHQNFFRNISLETAAGYIKVNKTYLCTIFKKEMGVGFTEYLKSYRIKRAKQLLESGKSIAETAQEVGFCDPKYFSRIFKENTGMLPREYKKQRKD